MTSIISRGQQAFALFHAENVECIKGCGGQIADGVSLGDAIDIGDNTVGTFQKLHCNVASVQTTVDTYYQVAMPVSLVGRDDKEYVSRHRLGHCGDYRAKVMSIVSVGSNWFYVWRS